MANRLTTALLLLGALVLWLPRAQAYEFVPTDAEWSAWPGYCKAKYAWTNIGRGSKFAYQVSSLDRSEMAQWEGAGIRGIHHYCAGTTWLQRARLEKDPRTRHFMLATAERETLFSLERSNTAAQQFVSVAVQMAYVRYEQGQFDFALTILKNLIPAHADSDILYSAAAVVLRKLGRLDDAKNILLQGNKATGGRSAEIHYNLGLVFLELGELDNAVAEADSAYEKGYPLLGLRSRLKRLGRY
jgi:tetratricopeptide (TPR) repeat protein